MMSLFLWLAEDMSSQSRGMQARIAVLKKRKKWTMEAWILLVEPDQNYQAYRFSHCRLISKAFSFYSMMSISSSETSQPTQLASAKMKRSSFENMTGSSGSKSRWGQGPMRQVISRLNKGADTPDVEPFWGWGGVRGKPNRNRHASKKMPTFRKYKDYFLNFINQFKQPQN